MNRQPVLEALGWHLKYQTHLQGRKPVYALFLTDADLGTALNAGPDAADFWTPAAAVADAKRWDLSLDKPVGRGAAREYPPEQIEWYLDRSRKPFVVLTNGRVWRLVPRELAPHQRRYQTYFEIDLPAVLAVAANPFNKAAVFDDFRRFFLLFGPAGFAAVDGRKPLLQRAVEGSSEYRLGVSEGLKGQAFEALRLCIEGFLAHPGNDLGGTMALAECRANGFTLLCRLLFILYAEDRQLLPYRRNRTYTDNRSLGRMRDEIAGRLEKAKAGRGDDFSRAESGIWDDLQQLFDLIDRGHGTYGVPAYNGGLFDTESHPFLTTKRVPDWYLVRVIDMLGRAADPRHPDGSLFRVDYRDLALQYLGGVYEGLLELKPALAAVPIVVYAKREKGAVTEQFVPETDPKPVGFTRTDEVFAPGSVYLIQDKGERRAFGSYYTPDHIVDHIVRHTLGPLCDDITAGIAAEVAAAEAAGADTELLHAAFPVRVLKLKVLDPSMGSGHFLLAACQYLAEQIATNPYTAADPAGGDATLGYWKRRVSECCLYGVDLNPLAVDLGKLAVWLETVSRDRPLTFLDHHLRHGNSLIGARLARLGALAGDSGAYKDHFTRLFRKKLPKLLEPLDDIRTAASDSRAAVKDKEKRHAAFRAGVQPFARVADVWTADAAGIQTADPGLYADALKVVDQPKAFDKLTADAGFTAAASAGEALAAFHWELSFPEVFADPAVGGFDAVVGNPPYEVLSLKESGTDPTALKRFVSADPALAPAVRGKQNLYKLFVCRSADLLRAGGRFGFIVPMPILGDDQSKGVRELLTTTGRFAAVEAFPHKDTPRKRVGRMGRLGEFCSSHQGELNEAADKTGSLSSVEEMGPIVLRGSAICLYQVREASQGETVYLNVQRYLGSEQPKAKDTRLRRVGFQRKAPQNNFRRLIAAEVEPNCFCFESISYITERETSLPLRFVLAVLNSVLADWYFRLGSSNAQVNEYQFNNLPCPRFRESATDAERAVGDAVAAHLTAHRPDKALAALTPLFADAPFSPVVRDAVVITVDAIVAAEADRGEISRTDRSALSPAAQPFQDFLDAVFFRLAGLTDAEVAGLRTRYEAMKKVK